MLGKDSRQAGFTLIEIMVVIMVLGVLLGVLVALLTAVGRQLPKASRAAEERVEAMRACDMLAGDIRAASGADCEDGQLKLTVSGGKTIVWLRRADRLVRVAGEAETAFGLRLEDFRVRLDAGVVEAVVRPTPVDSRSRQPFYVVARPRVSGGGK